MTPEQQNKNILDRYLRKLLRTIKNEKTQKYMDKDGLVDLVANEGIRSLGRTALRQQMQSTHSRMITRNKRKVRLKLALLFFIFIVAIGAFLFIKSIENNKYTPTDIYLAYFEPYPSLFEQKNGSKAQPDTSILTQAMKAYANKQFKLTNKAFEIADKRKLKLNQPQRFYRAIALMSTDQDLQAFNILISLKEEGSGPLNEQVIWYLSLSYLKTNQIDEARLLLRETVDYNVSHYKRKEMIEVLTELN